MSRQSKFPFTEPGTLVYPYVLNAHDGKFGQKYKTGLKLANKHAKELFLLMRDEARIYAEAHNLNLDDCKFPIKTNEETGEREFQFSVNKFGKKGEEQFEAKVFVVDEEGNRISQEPGNGSTGRVAYKIFPYKTKEGVFGVSLILKGVEIHKLVPVQRKDGQPVGSAKKQATVEKAAPVKKAPATSFDDIDDDIPW